MKSAAVGFMLEPKSLFGFGENYVGIEILLVLVRAMLESKSLLVLVRAMLESRVFRYVRAMLEVLLGVVSSIVGNRVRN